MAGETTSTARQLAHAHDDQVAQVVALIDTLAERGEADAVIAPLRRRLQRMRPPRPPRFGRILFAPLDPVIVTPRDWRVGQAAVPRPALTAFRALVVASLGPRAGELEQMVARYAGPPAEAPATIGPVIWPPAAASLRQASEAPPPPQWRESGLPAELFPVLGAAAGRVLQHAPAIEAWVHRDAEGEEVPARAIEQMFGGAASGASAALLAAVLIARLPRATADILRAAQAAAAPALDAATAHLHALAEGGIATAPLPELSRATERAALLLDALLRQAGPRRREELDGITRAVERQCRERFTDALAADVIAPACAVAPGAAAQAVPQIEAAARDLRRLQDAARRFGGNAGYDAMLNRAAHVVRELPPDASLSAADRIRLAELLVGPDQAMRLFPVG